MSVMFWTDGQRFVKIQPGKKRTLRPVIRTMRAFVRTNERNWTSIQVFVCNKVGSEVNVSCSLFFEVYKLVTITFV